MNFNILMENNEPKLVCRKCQGAHLTIKCGKETKSVIETSSRNDDLKSVSYSKKDINFKSERSERFENQKELKDLKENLFIK